MCIVWLTSLTMVTFQRTHASAYLVVHVLYRWYQKHKPPAIICIWQVKSTICALIVLINYTYLAISRLLYSLDWYLFSVRGMEYFIIGPSSVSTDKYERQRVCLIQLNVLQNLVKCTYCILLVIYIMYILYICSYMTDSLKCRHVTYLLYDLHSAEWRGLIRTQAIL